MNKQHVDQLHIKLPVLTLRILEIRINIRCLSKVASGNETIFKINLYYISDYIVLLFMPPTLKKLEGHIALGLSVCLSVCASVNF